MARSLETLQVELRAHQDRSPDAAKLAAADAGLPAKAVPQLRSVIKGHERKVYCVQWSGDSSRIASAGQEGFVLVTDPLSGMKTCAPVKASFAMATALNQDAKLLAHGGMDNTITITDIAGAQPITRKQCSGHDGYISALRFVPGHDNQLLSASGDGEAKLWDVKTGAVVASFAGHTSDCLCLSVAPDGPPKIFATGGLDNTVRLWDISSGKCVRTFIAKSEVNAVCMFPNGGAIAYATEQGQFGLFDVGSYACVSEGKTASKGAAMSVAVSRSGRVTYVGFEKGAISVCDTFDMSQYDGVTSGHERNVASMAVAPDGTAMATSGYDGLVKIWVGNA
uniref:Guanine nucleotide-binding protein subunit beta-like protein n=1 Tax=Phaeocystis antarctica TaxID=33657 RepID=A0A7S0EXB7_9EUKA|mmetsp:Transcript_32853/g.77687  ORF Transcript_32853/g.77687 Transcript_32853/m.77687 type:complete len:337 (+) Transcript_32853:26-1036(+)